MPVNANVPPLGDKVLSTAHGNNGYFDAIIHGAETLYPHDTITILCGAGLASLMGVIRATVAIRHLQIDADNPRKC